MSGIEIPLSFLVVILFGFSMVNLVPLWAAAISGIIIIPVGVLLMRADERKRNPLKAEKGILYAPQILWVLALGISLSHVLNLLLAVFRINEIFPSYSEQSAQAVFSHNFFFVILCGSIVAPVAEELLARGLVYQRLRDYVGVRWGILLSALIFGLVHGNMTQFIYATLMGFALAWVMETFHTLLAPILLHIAANGWSFVISYFGNALAKIGGGLLLGAILMAQILFLILSTMYIWSRKQSGRRK